MPEAFATKFKGSPSADQIEHEYETMMYYCNNPDMPDNEKPPCVKQDAFSKIR
jgi:hypothetical protein